jgi:hypothetical protein
VDKVQYKGFVISPAPQQLRDSGRWTMSLYIQRHRESVTEKNFSTEKTIPTKEEAAQQCVVYGKQIIDGEATSTVDGL